MTALTQLPEPRLIEDSAGTLVEVTPGILNENACHLSGVGLLAHRAVRRVLGNRAFYKQNPEIRAQHAAELRDWERRKGYRS
jgi:hypothetical protein